MRAVILLSVFGLAVPAVALLASLPGWWDIDGLRGPFARVLEILTFGFVLAAIAYITRQVMRSFFSKPDLGRTGAAIPKHIIAYKIFEFVKPAENL